MWGLLPWANNIMGVVQCWLGSQGSFEVEYEDSGWLRQWRRGAEFFEICGDLQTNYKVPTVLSPPPKHLLFNGAVGLRIPGLLRG